MSKSPQRLQRSRQYKMVSPNGLPIVYVGRPTKWGNAYYIGVDGNWDQVLKKYRGYLEASSGLVNEAKKELRGKNLACWCKPTEDCHADILLEIANEA
ncbi:MAG: DUF4326 domain-containing protein [Ktedonobacteraceae bacterium]